MIHDVEYVIARRLEHAPQSAAAQKTCRSARKPAKLKTPVSPDHFHESNSPRAKEAFHVFPRCQLGIGIGAARQPSAARLIHEVQS